ncbi:MAG: cobalamin-dependent protein [Candidatus Lokiarchaeota archaeon]|nr:cobalamin-dependent protein [Candidatus Lokiarchaeota archaeon]
MQNVETEHVELLQEDKQYIDNIVDAVRSLDFYSMKAVIKDAIDAGISTIKIIKRGVLEGLEDSGEMGLILAAEALSDGLLTIDEEKRQELARARNYKGKVVIGTIQGDIHSLGKSILIAIMKSFGMDVIDLGVDVSPEDFLEAAKLPDVKVIGISFLLSSVEPAVKRAVELLKNGNLELNPKIILGGAAVSEDIAEELKVDAFTKDAIEGVDFIDIWLRN